jgi:hypothetical protein
MISRNLSQRLKRLEARAMPAGDSIVMEIQFVSPEKVVTGTLLVEIGPGAHRLGHLWLRFASKVANDNV